MRRDQRMKGSWLRPVWAAAGAVLLVGAGAWTASGAVSAGTPGTSTSPAVRAGAATTAGMAIGPGRPRIVGKVPRTSSTTFPAPPTDTQCQTYFAPLGVSQCFNPRDIRRAYGVDSLIAAGHEGRGQTIVIVDAFGSPTLRQDLEVFDHGYQLIAPPSLRVLSPLGSVKFDPSSAVEAEWADETTLDVEWAHAMAPQAGIVVLTSPVNEDEGTRGMGDFLKLEQYAFNHHLGDIISQSWGATENTLETNAGRAMVTAFDNFYARADRHEYTILAAAGDTGSENTNTSGAPYSKPTVIFPASSPDITAVGGTSLRTRSERWASEVVWNDGPSGGAGGGGISQLFRLPAFQQALPATARATLNGHRGLPDVSWNADPDTSILIYSSFGGPNEAGWYLVGGTSEGSPQWAGLVADVNQARRTPIGFLNPDLYALPEADYHDVVKGTNRYDGVSGYRAGAGWDAASGLGTPTATLDQALIRAPSKT